MRSWIAICVVVVGLAGLCTPLYGAIYATEYLSGDPTVISQIEDFDWELLIYDPGGDNEVSDGDIFLGVFEAEKIIADYTDSGSAFTPSPPGGDVNFTAVFANKVANKSGNDTDGYEWDFEPLNEDDWDDLQGWLSNVPDRKDDDSMIIVYSDDDPSNTGWIDPDNDVNATVGRASDGTLMYEFGGSDTETWFASSDEDDIDDLNALDNLNWYAGLSVLYTSPSALPLMSLPYSVIGFGNTYDMELSGSSQGTIEDGTWLKTDSSIYVNAIPEPTSVLIWSGLLGLLGLAAFRKRSGNR